MKIEVSSEIRTACPAFAGVAISANACGNFYILTDDDGIQYTLGHSSFVTSMNIYVGVFDDDCRRMTESLQKTLF